MRRLWIAVSLAGVALGGCAVGYAYDLGYGYDADYVGYAGPSGSVYASVAPPAPLVEVVPPQPGPGYAWINGYWGWDGQRYVWNRGSWGLPPGPGYAWQPYGWVAAGPGYRFVPGRWYPYGSPPNIQYVYPRPPLRQGPYYGVLPPAQTYPYAYIPRQYYYHGPVYATPGGPPSYVYRVP